MIWNWSQLKGMTSNMGDKAILEARARRLSPYKKKSIVIIGNYGFGNLGDEAMLTGILDRLRKDISNAEFTVFSYDPEETKKVYNVSACYLMSFRVLLELIKADVVIIGSGSLLNTPVGYLKNRMCRYVIISALLAELFRKKVVFYAIGIETFDFITRIMLPIIMKWADKISVRTPHSKSILKALGVRRNIHVTPDPSLELDPIKDEKAQKLLREEGVNLDKFLVGLNLRYIGDKQTDKRLMGVITQFVDWLVEAYDAEIVFIPMCKNKYRRLEFDPFFAEEVYKLVKYKERMKILKKQYTPQETMGIIGQMNLLIGTRLHSQIFAYKLGIPLIGIVYSGKNTAFLEMIGQRDGIEFSEVSFEKLREIMKKKIKN